MKLLLNGPVEHDGKVHAEGTIVDLADEHGQPLLDAGVATAVLEDVAPKGKKSKDAEA